MVIFTIHFFFVLLQNLVDVPIIRHHLLCNLMVKDF